MAENRGQISHFIIPVKSGEGWANCYNPIPQSLVVSLNLQYTGITNTGKATKHATLQLVASSYSSSSSSAAAAADDDDDGRS